MTKTYKIDKKRSLNRIKLLDSSASNLQSDLNFANSSLKIENDEWLTTVQAASFLQMPVGTLRNLTCNGKIPYYKLGRSNRYRREELRNLLLSNRRGARNEY